MKFFLSRGKDLPSGKNIADYIDCWGHWGRMDATKFALGHCTQFPTLFDSSAKGGCNEKSRGWM